MWKRTSLYAPLSAVALFLGACQQGAVEPPTAAVGPGQSAWNDADMQCASDADCNPGEACRNGVCELQRCTQTYSSLAPLGQHRPFGVDRELAVVAGTRLDGYEPRELTFTHPSDATLAPKDGGQLVDAAGGHLLKRADDVAAVVTAGIRGIRLVGKGLEKTIALDFQPEAVAVGDVDNDGMDEVAALSGTMELALCTGEGRCQRTKLANGTGRDLTVGDVDGDGKAEIIALGITGGRTTLYLWRPKTESVGEPDVRSIPTSRTLWRIASGDTDGNGTSEIFGLVDDGTFNDTGYVISLDKGQAKELSSTSVDVDAIDVAAMDLDDDRRDEFVVLTGSGSIEVFGPSSTGYARTLRTGLSSTRGATRLAAFDLDGDSPRGTLDGGPDLVAGDLVPVSVLVHPPFSKQFSDGRAEASVGSTTLEASEQRHSVSLQAGLAISLGGEVDVFGLFGLGGAAGARIGGSITKARSVAESVFAWDGYGVVARPELDGPNNGAVLVACGCFHKYGYTVDDPAKKLNVGSKMEFFVPVGSQTTVWSLKRYNAMTKKIPSLPVIQVPYTIGDPNSYPTEPRTLEGAPIPKTDLVFTKINTFRVSDVAGVSWRMSASNDETNATALEANASAFVEGKVTVGVGVKVTGDVGISETSGYSVTVGKGSVFGGWVPPVRDNPSTPEDEYKAYRYSFSPIVYRQAYKDARGRDSAYYVQTFVVNR